MSVATSSQYAGEKVGRSGRILVAGQAASWLGSSFHPIALSVALLQSGYGGKDLGAVLSVSALCQVSVALFGGVLADRRNPKSIMIWADVVRAAAAASLAVMMSVDDATLLGIAIASGCMGLSGGFFGPAMSALKVQIAEGRELVRLNANVSMANTGATIAGPVLAGAAVGLIGPGFGFFINASSFVISLVCIAAIQNPAIRKTEGEGKKIRESLHDGFTTVTSQRWLASGFAAAAISNLAYSAMLVVVPLVAIRDLGGPGSLGTLTAVGGSGALIGAKIRAKYRGKRPLFWAWAPTAAIAIWPISYAAANGTMVVIAIATFFSYFIVGFHGVAWESTIQENVPTRLIGRVAAWEYVVSCATLPLGSLLAGLVSDGSGIATTAVMCAVLYAATPFIALAPRAARSM